MALSQMLERNITVYKEEENKVTPQEFIASNSTKPPVSHVTLFTVDMFVM